MGMKYAITKYSQEYENKWDKFVMNSANGTFLQTRNFLNYHNKRFEDCSLLFMKGSEIVAGIPANMYKAQDVGGVFESHQGSTFGGIIINESSLKVSVLEELFSQLEAFFTENQFSKVVFKQPGRIYSKYEMDLLEYYFFNKGYETRYEVGYYIDFECYKEDILSNLSSSRRRDYKYSLKNKLLFKELHTDIEIEQFYCVLLDNYKKFNKTPVHSLDELLEFHNVRLLDISRFFGVFLDDVMIAGAMVFCFDNSVFHTQYLAVLNDYSNLFANEFLYVSLIEAALADDFRFFSLGTTVLDGGQVLNYNLAQFKEGFGTKQYNNKTFVKNYDGNNMQKVGTLSRKSTS